MEAKEIEIVRKETIKEIEAMITDVESMEADEKEKKALIKELKAEMAALKKDFAAALKKFDKKYIKSIERGVNRIKSKVHARGKKFMNVSRAVATDIKRTINRAENMNKKFQKKMKAALS
ncbi:MAG: hypothetical protein AAGB05_01260 [Pseudomonadota bacterium]